MWIKNIHKSLGRIFFALCFTSAVWLFCYSIGYKCEQEDKALFWLKMGYAGIVFIAVTVVHFTAEFLGVEKIRKYIFGVYVIGGVFVAFIWMSKLIVKSVAKYSWGYYPLAGSWHPLFLTFFMGLISLAFTLLLYYLLLKGKDLSVQKKSQIKYLFSAIFIYNLASADFFPNYGIDIYPFGCIPAFLFIFVIGYSIVKHRLMDIKVALTRGAILLIVYAFIVGIPVALVFSGRFYLQYYFHERWFVPPLGLYTVLALLAPYIYLTLQNRAEQKRMKQQLHLHQSLKAASQTTIEVQSIDKLSRIIPRYLLKLYGQMDNKISHISLFLLDKGKKAYHLKSSVGREKISFGTVITPDSYLIKWFTKIRDVMVEKGVLKIREVEVLVYEDIDFWLNNPSVLRLPFKGLGGILKELKGIMKSLNANVILPSVYQKELLGFLILGEKTPDSYTTSDIDTFSILANDSAMAFKAAALFEDLKTAQARLIQSEKLNLLGQLASSMAHEINNPLAIISGNIQLLLMDEDDDKKKKVLKKINDQTERSYKIINRLLNFSRLSKEDIKDVEMHALIDDTLELINHKILHGNIQMDKDYNCTQHIKGNPTQIQEVLLNLFVNAVQAMPQGGRLQIYTKDRQDKIEVVVQDTGKGIPQEDVENVFDPFYTQGKENGTGLGLFVASQIMGLHGGSIEVKSKVGEGTAFVLKFAVGLNKE